MFCEKSAVPLPSVVKTVEINWFHLVDAAEDMIYVYYGNSQELIAFSR